MKWLMVLGLGAAGGVAYYVHKQRVDAEVRRVMAQMPVPAPADVRSVITEAVFTPTVPAGDAKPPFKTGDYVDGPRGDDWRADATVPGDESIEQETNNPDEDLDEDLAAFAAAPGDGVPEEEWGDPQALDEMEFADETEIAEEPGWGDPDLTPTQMPNITEAPEGGINAPNPNAGSIISKIGKLGKPKPKSPTPASKPTAKGGLTSRVTRFARLTKGKTSAAKTLDATNSIADLPWLRDRESIEPGFVRQLVTLANSTGGDVDRLAAVIYGRSKFNPQNQKQLTETGKTGYGLFGWPDPNVKSMTGIAQVLGPLKNSILTRPWLASDPALIVLVPYMSNGTLKEGAFAGRSDGVVVVRQPNVDISAHATTLDEALWPRIGHWDKDGNGEVTVGDIRRSFYKVLDGVTARVPA